MQAKLFIHTDKVYAPVKPLDSFTEEEKAQTRWPHTLRHILAISIRPERYQRLVANAGWLGGFVRKVEGVDGRALGTIEQLTEQGIYAGGDRYNHMTRGQIACFLSHRRAWQRVVDEQLPTALILEDDCDLVPHPYTLRYINDVVERELNFPWDVLYLGRNPALCETLGGPIRQHLVHTGRTWGLFAYAVTLQSATQLLESTRGPIEEPVDIRVSTMKQPRRRVGFSPIALFIRTDEESDTEGIA